MNQESMFSEGGRKESNHQLCMNCKKTQSGMPVFSMGFGRMGICRDCIKRASDWFQKLEPSKYHGKLRTCLYCRSKRFKKMIVFDEGGEAIKGICHDCVQRAEAAFVEYDESRKPKQLNLW